MAQLDHTIGVECTKQGLSPEWVWALISVESSQIQWVMRYEPGYSYFVTPEFFAKKLGQSLDTELNGQKTSWGLLQVMGGTAREMGFSGYFPELCLPSVGIHYGCRYLAQKLRKYGNYLDAVAAYNAGTVKRLPNGDYQNQAYVDKVAAKRASLG